MSAETTDAPAKQDWRDGLMVLPMLAGLISLVMALFRTAWFAAALLLLGIVALYLLGSVGKAFRSRHDLPLPGIVLAPLAVGLLIFGALQIGHHGADRLARTFAEQGASRISQARAQLDQGDGEGALATLEPIAKVKDDRIVILSLAAEAMKASKSDRPAAARKLADEGEVSGKRALYEAAINMLGPYLLQGVRDDRVAEAQAETEAKRYERLFNWDGSVPSVVAAVKAQMHNPDSFKHVQTDAKRLGDEVAVNMTYRGTNGLGAMVAGEVIATVTMDGRVLRIEQVR